MIGSVTFFAALCGAVWGGLWMLLLGVLLMLVTGLIVTANIGVAAVVGVGIAIAIIARNPSQRSYRYTAMVAGCSGSALLLTTAFAPFGVAFGDTATAMQAVMLIAWCGLTTLTVTQILNGFAAGSARRYRLEVLAIRLLKGLGLILFGVFVALPFYVMVMTSLKSQQSLLANPLDFSIDLSAGVAELFGSYIDLFTEFHFATFLINSAVVSLVTVFVTLVFAIPGAYTVARLRFPGRDFLSRSILLIYMVPAIVLVIPLYAVFSQLGLRNSLVGLMVVYPATTIPVALYMLQGYFRGLPSELEDAGLMDGLTRLQVIFKITLPLALPALASVFLYVFMIAWNEFLFAFMFLDDFEIFTLSRGVVSLNSSEVPRQHLMAGAVVATVPVLVIFLWFEKYLVSGLTAGSVKG